MAMMMIYSSFSVLPVVAITEQQSKSAEKSYIDEDVLAYAILGENVETKGMKVWMGDVNEPKTAVEAGKQAWRLDPTETTASRYIYIDIDDELVQFHSDGRNLEVIVEYFDGGNGSLTLEYPDLDTTNSHYNQRLSYNTVETVKNIELDILDFNDTKQWKTHTWLLQHPSLQNDINKADFRFGIYSVPMGYSRKEVYVASVTVKATDSCGQLGIDVASDNLGHIFYTDEDMEFSVTFDNTINPIYAQKNGKYNAKVTYTISDSRDNEVFKTTNQIEIKPRAKTTDHVSYKPERYDLYTLKIEVENKEKKIYATDTRQCSYVWTTYGEILNPRAGVCASEWANTKFEAEGLAKMIRNAGYSYVRQHFAISHMGMVSYNNLDPTEWAQHQNYSDQLAAYSEYGLKLVCYTSDDIRKNNAPVSNVDESGGVPKSEASINRFFLYNQATMDILDGTMYAFGMDNEMNLFYPTADDHHMPYNVKALAKAYPILKKKYPNIIFFGPEAGGNKIDLWKRFFEEGGHKYVDVFSGHWYPEEWTAGTMPKDGTAYMDNIVAIRKLMEEYGVADKEFWVTESGESTYYLRCDSNYEAACTMLGAYCTNTAPGHYDKIFRYQFHDGPVHFRDAVQRNFGIVNTRDINHKNRLAAQESYLQESAMNIMMHDAEQIEYIQMDEVCCFRYNKTESGKQMFVMFKDGEGESDTMSLDLGVNEVVFFDMYGNQRKLNSTNGTYTFAVDMEPFYVVGDFTKFDEIESSVVRPESTLYTVEYNDELTVPFTNETGKNLTVKVNLWDNSKIETVETAELPQGGSGISFKMGSTSPKTYDAVRVTISDNEGKVYFDDDIFFNYVNALAMDTILSIDESGDWCFESTISNSSSHKTYTGTLQLASPVDWLDRVEKKVVTLNPGETQTIKLKITDRDESTTRLRASLGYVLNEGMGEGLYLNKIFDFAHAPKADNVTIDAELSEWTDGWMYLDNPGQFKSTYAAVGTTFYGAQDLWGRVAVKWDEDNFYFAGETHDDIHYAKGVDAENMWQIDNIQIGIVYDPDNTLAKDRFEEMSFALLEGVPTIHRNRTNFGNTIGDPTKLEGSELAIVNNGNITTYELKVPWSSLVPGVAKGEMTIEAGKEFKLGVLLNENDGGIRKGFYFLGDDGIGSGGKDSGKFVKLFIAE